MCIVLKGLVFKIPVQLAEWYRALFLPHLSEDAENADSGVDGNGMAHW